MDLVDYREKVFLSLREKIARLLKNFSAVSIIPASALKNENIDQSSKKQSYKAKFKKY